MSYGRIFTNLIPTLLIPPAVIPSMNIGCTLFFLALYTLPIPTKRATIARGILAALSLPFFWDIAFGMYHLPNLNQGLGLSCFGIYGMMRVSTPRPIVRIPHLAHSDNWIGFAGLFVGNRHMRC